MVKTVSEIGTFHADKKEAGSRTVTPDKGLRIKGYLPSHLVELFQFDENNPLIPSAPTPQYNNNPQIRLKVELTPTPENPGYVTDTPKCNTHLTWELIHSCCKISRSKSGYQVR